MISQTYRMDREEGDSGANSNTTFSMNLNILDQFFSKQLIKRKQRDQENPRAMITGDSGLKVVSEGLH